MIVQGWKYEEFEATISDRSISKQCQDTGQSNFESFWGILTLSTPSVENIKQKTD